MPLFYEADALNMYGILLFVLLYNIHIYSVTTCQLQVYPTEHQTDYRWLWILSIYIEILRNHLAMEYIHHF